MAVVLTVIAMVVGGMVIGKSLIRSAELQSVIADAERFKKATKLFHDKYKYLPGDFPLAASNWGADIGCDTDMLPNIDSAPNGDAPKQETCGGDGDGFIGGRDELGEWPTPANMKRRWRESLRSWQHLANAHFIEGAFSGVLSSSTIPAPGPGVGIPGSKVSGKAGFNQFYAGTINDANRTPSGVVDTWVFPGKYGHVIGFGSVLSQVVFQADRESFVISPALTAADAAHIDGKLDDGRPGTGTVVSLTPNNPRSPNCATSAVAADARYRTGDGGITCALVFVTGL